MPAPFFDSTALKAQAATLGFFQCGVAKAERMEEEARRLEDWLNQGKQGQMAYMANHFDLRIDPTQLVPGARTVISLAFNYHNPDKPADPEAPKISQYAYGEDYHHVLRKRLKSLLAWIRDTYGPVEGRVFVDSAPVLERDWARRSGVGWVGKHTLLIHPKAGSYFFLAELIIDLAFAPDPPIRDHCGTCRRCIDACPTDAISPAGYSLDASKCISYLTIELRDAIPGVFQGKMEGWMFGCDICQEVCPWNRFASRHNEPAFDPHPDLLHMSASAWEECTDEVFNHLFSRSPVRRTGLTGLRRNIRFLQSGAGVDKDTGGAK
ncbi:MAG: tRNA epoxyqueuosine(34) reductase QueG [Saprospiraceae bacterium]|nr:tRNA epoxyqueuosine(34) reductase QueG [Saprospiraceae bacterium]